MVEITSHQEHARMLPTDNDYMLTEDMDNDPHGIDYMQ